MHVRTDTHCRDKTLRLFCCFVNTPKKKKNFSSEKETIFCFVFVIIVYF